MFLLFISSSVYSITMEAYLMRNIKRLFSFRVLLSLCYGHSRFKEPSHIHRRVMKLFKNDFNELFLYHRTYYSPLAKK